ncbi:MAG: hypothetical protein KJ799_12325 [Bacteroidetes bacterium]|nr:hypothetical protein [Bacteroidota bacterium]MBU1678745.1 hypothetical protein [Bacteroidota bacterium]MBU2507491.1 hypothetical protein [Bacteroidota bacterium]
MFAIIIDNHKIFRSGLSSFLKKFDSSVEIEEMSFSGFFDRNSLRIPDLILTTLTNYSCSEINTITKIKEQNPSSKIFAVAKFIDDRTIDSKVIDLFDRVFFKQEDFRNNFPAMDFNNNRNIN